MNRVSTLPLLLLLASSAACDAGPGGPTPSGSTGGASSGADADSDSSDTGEPDGVADTGDTGAFDVGFEREPVSAAAFAAVREEARADRVQVYSVDPSSFVYVVGEQGTILRLPADSMVTASGLSVTGSVDLQLVELYDKGSMLVTDMPSVGLDSTGARAQLISGGEHYVQATQGGEALDLVGELRIDAPVANTGEPSADMTRFRAVNTDGEAAGLDDADVWVEEDAEVALGRAEGVDGVETTYSLLSSQFGWTNVDRWYSDPREKTTLAVRPPVGWDDSNSAVYLSYDGEPTALAGLDTFDEETGVFSEHYGLLPIGLEVHVIFVTATEDGWAYAIQGTTIAADEEIHFDDADALLESDTDGFVEVINSLP